MNLPQILNITDWISVVLTLLAVFYILLIGRMNGWFAAWITLAIAFSGIVVRRIIVSIASIPGIDPILKSQLGYANQILQFILAILYLVNFYLLYRLFKKNLKGNKK